MTFLHRIADRFLAWYCNPDFLEEIHGDIKELHIERLARTSKLKADIGYIWDILRFCRWSNIRRTGYTPGISGLMTLNLKMAWRQSARNKTVFAIKTLGLSLCLSFALILAGFIVGELTADHFHQRHDRIYRVGLKAIFKDHTTDYAVTPLPTGAALLHGISGIEQYFRFMHLDKPVFKIDDQFFNNQVTLGADSNFLRVLSYQFIRGSERSLDGPNKIVLTERTAAQFFGGADPLGQTVLVGQNQFAEVSGIIRNVPSNSHLQFDALISWETFDFNDDWGNINTYTYILLREGASLDQVLSHVSEVFTTFDDLIIREYQARAEFHFDKLDDIHFLGYRDEDIALKSNRANIWILLAVGVLFYIIGLINFLNLSLAELTANLKKIGVAKALGGIGNSSGKIILAESLLSLAVVIPMTALLTYAGLIVAQSSAAITIDQRVWYSVPFVSTAFGLLLLILFSLRINSHVVSKVTNVVLLFRGKLSSGYAATDTRKHLVAVQLCFSVVMIGLMIVIADQFYFIQNMDKGLESGNVMIVRLRSGPASSVSAFESSLKNIAGVKAVARSTYYPGALETKYVFGLESETGMREQLVNMMLCSRNYLQSLRVHVEQGRHFLDSASEADTYIINEAAAKSFGWKNPIGKKIRGPVSGGDEAFQEGVVVGVTTDFHFNSLHNAVEPMIMLVDNDEWLGNYLYIKSDPMHGDNLVGIIEQAYRDIWSDQVFEWEYLDQRYASFYARDEQMKSIFEFGLVISVAVCCLGIFSISALLLRLRTRESCIRKVVGASDRQLFFLHTGAFIRLTVVAIIIACPLIAWLADQWLTNFAYHVSFTPIHFIIPAALALFITVFMSGYHGLRSGRINIVNVLKEE